MLTAPRPMRAPLASKLFLVTALTGAFFSSSACSSDEKPSGSPDGGTGGSEETGGKGNGGSSMGGKGGAGGTAGKAGSAGTGATGTGGAVGDSGACTGGPSMGTNDAGHCKEADGGAIKQEIGACKSGTADAGAGGDYGDTLYGLEGVDDDCKYNVKYTVTPICQDAGTTFTITLTKTSDGKAATGAAPYIEATLNGLPASVADKQKPTEKAGGVYEVGPVVFDKPGKWVARFHFFETCADSEDSPHGHVAFFMDVP